MEALQVDHHPYSSAMAHTSKIKLQVKQQSTILEIQLLRVKITVWWYFSLRNAQQGEQKQAECLCRDKCTIRSDSSQAACTSCLIPESDTLTPPPAPPLSPSLYCLIHALLSNEDLLITTSKLAVKIWPSGIHPHPHFC